METRPWHSAYDPGVPPTIDYANVPLHGFLRRAAARFPDFAAVCFLNRTFTYRELDHYATRFARALEDAGVVKGDRVAIQLPNLPQTVIAFFGTLRAGAVAVMTNPLYTSREIEHQWNDAGCKVAVTADFLYRKSVAKVRDRLSVETYVIARIPEYLRFPLNVLAPLKLKREGLMADVPRAKNVFRFREFVDAALVIRPEIPLEMSDLAALQYTGGTTGVPKGAMLTHGNLSWQAQQLHAWLPDLEPGKEVFLSALPFFHVFGLTVAMSLPVELGATMVLMPNPRDVEAMIDAINRRAVTIFPVVPAMVHGINQHPNAASLEVKGLKICVSGSAPMPEPTLRRFEELTGGKIVEGYGLTEASPVTHVNPNRGRRKVNTIGLPLPDTDCRILSMKDGTTPVGPGEDGELVIRGPQVMAGYWKRPDETAHAIRDGWLHTGDLAAADEDGYFRISGRLKDLILCSGYNVYPDEVDRIIVEHPAVLECATIGVPDEKRGESVKSFVVRRPGADLSADELTAWCRDRLAAYKVPRRIEFRAELPKSSVLKILRRQLLEEELAGRGK
ncbi:MAG: long-chain-fatty-acid--CoA ligase [Candidatus Eiseniibacteriota bacterium]